MMNITEKRNIWLMVLGILVSKTGSVAFTFAVGLHVLKLTGSAMSLGISVLLFTIPRLVLTPYAGMLADSFSRKHIIVFGDIISGIIVLSLMFFQSSDLVVIYIIVALLSSVQAFFEVAFQAAQPDIVTDTMLFKLNAYSQSAMSVTNILGYVLSGLLLAMGMPVVVLVNGISFIVSGISEWFIDFDFNRQRQAQRSAQANMREQYREAVNFFKQTPIVGYVVGLSLGANFFIALSVSVPLVYMMNQTLGIPEVYIGIVNAILSVGIFVCSVVMAKRGATGLYRNSYVFAIVVAVTLAMMGLPFSLGIHYAVWQAVLILGVLHFVAGYAVPAFSIPIITMEQKLIPETMRGKVFGLINLIADIGRPLAIFISSLIVPTVAPMSILLFSGAMIVFITVVVMSMPQVKVAFNEIEMTQRT